MLTYRVVFSTIKVLIRLLCRVDDTQLARVPDQVRQQMIDEVMYQMAALLPPPYRGVYSDLAAATERHLRFPPGVESNLRRAQFP